MNITIVSVDDIKNVIGIPKSLLNEKIEPMIFLAENYYCYDILGVALVSEIKNQITGGTVSPLNQVLIDDYITQIVAYAAVTEFISTGGFSIDNKGVTNQNDPNNTSLSIEQLRFYRDNLEPKIPFFQNRLKNYLKDNADKYPLYRADVKVKSHNSSGIYLGFFNRNKRHDDRY